MVVDVTTILDTQEHLNSLKRELSVVSKDLSSVVEQRSKLVSEISSKHVELASLNQQLFETREAIKIDLQIVANAKESLALAKTKQESELRKRVSELRSEIRNAQFDFDLINHNIDNAVAELSKKVDMLNEAHAKLSSLDNEIIEKNKSIALVNQKITTLSGILSEAQSEYETTKRVIVNEIDSKKIELKKIDNLIKERQDSYATVKTDFAQREAAIQERENNLAVLLARFIPYWNEVFPGRVIKI